MDGNNLFFSETVFQALSSQLQIRLCRGRREHIISRPVPHNRFIECDPLYLITFQFISSVIRPIEEILSAAKEAGASDVHLTVGIPPKMRVNGNLITMNYPRMMPADNRCR